MIAWRGRNRRLQECGFRNDGVGGGIARGMRACDLPRVFVLPTTRIITVAWFFFGIGPGATAGGPDATRR